MLSDYSFLVNLVDDCSLLMHLDDDYSWLILLRTLIWSVLVKHFGWYWLADDSSKLFFYYHQLIDNGFLKPLYHEGALDNGYSYPLLENIIIIEHITVVC